MACAGCRETQQQRLVPIYGECKTFAMPLDGAHVEIIVRGAITEKNLPLVKQYMALTYDAIESFTEDSE